MPAQPSHFSVLTFNLLAPCYKRLFSTTGQERLDRERDHSHLWNDRLDQILNLLDSITPAPDIIALQEVWFHPPFFSRLEQALSEHYHIFVAKRPTPKDDGLATLIRKNHPLLSQPTRHASFSLSNTDRVALAVRLSINSSSPTQPQGTLLIVNTHLTFPHDHFLRRVRDKQVHALTSFVSSFVSSSTGPVSTVVLGDFNSDMRSTVGTRMLDAHFLNCYTALNGPAAHPTTHYNHRRQQVFVDHVFLRNDAVRASISCDRPNTALQDASPRPRSPSRSRSGSANHTSSTTSKSPSSRPRSSSPSTIGLPDVFDLQAPVPRPPHSCESFEPLTLPLQAAYIRPIASAVYPEEMPNEDWPLGYHVSDHRPVGISFGIEFEGDLDDDETPF